MLDISKIHSLIGTQYLEIFASNDNVMRTNEKLSTISESMESMVNLILCIEVFDVIL